VVVSTLLSYFYASESPASFSELFLLGTFGFFITGAANIANQILEMRLDALMDRTRLRPLPTGILTPAGAGVYSLILLVAGLAGIGWFFNVLSALLSLVSYILYVLLYTPMKQRSPLSVLIGAFPGALPVLVGCVAASGNVYPDYLILFGIQFFWQFPHFWAIAWVLDDDYRKAGFRMLPFGRTKDSTAAYYIFIYTAALVLVSLFPSFLNLVGLKYTITAALAGVGFLFFTVLHLKRLDNTSARKVMFFSFFYLPVVQLMLAIDKL
jgi:protoheme IX farnesyltransferase